MDRYLNHICYVKSFMDGEDLKKLGVKPGPRLGNMLERLREAKMDGLVITREDEEAMVRRLMGDH